VLADQGAAEEARARHDDGRQDQRQRRQLRPRPPGQHRGECLLVVIERTRQQVEQIADVVSVAGLFFFCL